MSEVEPVHLWSGITVCSELKSWCGAEIVVIYNVDTGKNHVTNATDAEERCTCESCLASLREAKAKILG
jgi:hypothetical protein